MLVYVRETFYAWSEGRWTELEIAELRASLYNRFADAVYIKPGKEASEASFQPNKRNITDLVDALQAIAFRPKTLTSPSWIDGTGPPANEIVACANGLLHVPNRTLQTHTPAFFNHHCVPFEYDPNAPTPHQWLKFLDELWPGDVEAIATLQEMLGYLISGDTSLQKMFLLVGPKRSGKGTIARVTRQLLGPHHVAGSTLASLGSNFGLEPLVNATATFIPDARLPKGDSSTITERLLSITGEDTLTVDRKHRGHWTGRLPTRIVLMSNELPRMTDTSGALASRFVVLTMTRSFYGCENPNLTNQLVKELPGILNWALDGLDQLRARGRFVQPQSSTDAIRQLEDLGSPVGAFVRDRCVVGSGHQVGVHSLWEAWKAWCKENGPSQPGTKQTLGRELGTAVPGLKRTQPKDAEGNRYRAYQGIAIANRS